MRDSAALNAIPVDARDVDARAGLGGAPEATLPWWGRNSLLQLRDRFEARGLRLMWSLAQHARLVDAMPSPRSHSANTVPTAKGSGNFRFVNAALRAGCLARGMPVGCKATDCARKSSGGGNA